MLESIDTHPIVDEKTTPLNNNGSKMVVFGGRNVQVDHTAGTK